MTGLVDSASLTANVDSVLQASGITGAQLSGIYGLDPRREENHWVSIYPPLGPESNEPRAMLDSFERREWNEIAFLYFHLPFCAKKCDFCYFYITTDLSNTRSYVDRLRREAREYLTRLSPRTVVRHLYFGGGTPSVVPPEYLRSILEDVLEHIPRENIGKATLEIHPRTLKPGYESLVRSGLFNRISIGVQTFDPSINDLTNRIVVTPDRIRSIICDFRSAGVKDVNLDFMVGLRGQTTASVLNDLAEIACMADDNLIDSITVYPRSFTPSSIVMLDESITGTTVLERLRMELLYRAFFERRSNWKESPMYYYSVVDQTPVRQPSSCVTDANVIAKLGFGNSAYSYFDHANYRNTMSYSMYMDTTALSTVATGSWSRLSESDLKRRHIIFGVKRGYIDFKFPAPLTAVEQESFDRVSEKLQDGGFCYAKPDRIELSPIGKVMVEWVIRQYRAAFEDSSARAAV